MKEIVSVVIPIYNGGNNISICIDSILGQDYSDLEIVLIDDGSTDNTKEICEKYMKLDSRIKYYYTKNQGAGPARNLGINKSTGRYIYFPDADDLIEPNAISSMVDAMMVPDVDLVVFGYRYISQEGKELSKKVYDDFIKDGELIRKDYSKHFVMGVDNAIQGAPWNKMFDLNVIKENNILFPNLRRHQDECFISRYMSKSKKVHFIKDVLYSYYVNTIQMEGEKYPDNYLDIVIELHKERLKNVYVWNEHDEKTHNMANLEYLNGIIKSFELSFSKKDRFKNRKEHIEWIKKSIEKCKIAEIEYISVTGLYRGNIYRAISMKNYVMLYNLIRLSAFLKSKRIILEWLYRG